MRQGIARLAVGRKCLLRRIRHRKQEQVNNMRRADIMNLLLSCRSTGVTRHLELSTARCAGLVASLGALLVASFGLGYGSARALGYLPREDRIVELQQQVAGQQESLGQARNAAQDQLDALAIRVGQLNASVIRLNALGGRLTEMASLDDGEFDFTGAPAVGGPEELAGGPADISGLTADLDALHDTLERQERQLAVLADLLVNRKLREERRPRGRPVKSGYVSSYFGRRTDPFTGRSDYHKGVDFASKTGTEVVAVALGVVTWSGDRPGYGRMVEVNHGNGYVTRYAHNARNLVAVGERVQPGQTIALMGASGRATGPNLHFEVWYGGRPVDPGRFIRQST
jgi:murein DD-endopeptidase MepM/ murein hydrolase activator NlpD